MAAGTLSIDLDALAANWRALNARCGAGTETGAVVKADGYGLGAGPVARALARAGARRFFVALAEEGAALRAALGPGPEILVLSGHMAGDAALLREAALTPVLNAAEQLVLHFESLGDHPFGIQLDTGMNRLGMEPAEWAEVAGLVLDRGPALVMSHLACADDPADPMNDRQLALFRALTDGIDAPRSLAATGGILLGPAYHFDLVRPGIGLYGGAPFAGARSVVHLSLPVIQLRDLEPGEPVGYGCTWVAPGPARIATVAGGYADGILRALSNRAALWAGAVPCPLAGRVSMDLLTVDVTHLAEVPDRLDLIGPHQTVDDLAAAAGTIGYEVLTSLGPRYARRVLGAGA
jgi:alanine racemase